ncbi:MAG: hypothetical protein JWQ18_2038 [Conexibacter sp.]|nr:hypothetical protein [Conexibacter sp.]
MHLPRHPAAIAASMLAVGALGTGVALAAAAGDADPDFNGGAPALIDFPGSGTHSLQALTVAPDGSIFAGAGGFDRSSLWLAHLSDSGAPVAGFGTDGVVTDDAIAGLATPAEALAVAGDGDLLVGVRADGTEATGYLAGKVAAGAWGTGDDGLRGDFTVERYDASGTRVGESRVDIDPTSSFSDATMVAILPQADGTTLLLGSAYVDGHERFVRVLLGADGVPVASFGDDGVAIDTGNPDEAYAIAGGYQAGGPAGSVLIAGIGEQLVLRRYLADGSVDASFGGAFAHEPFGGTAIKTAAIAPDGSTYFSMNFGDEIQRVTAAGQRDASYGTGGVVRADIFVFRMAVQADGKLLLAGADRSGRTLVERLNADGTPDTTYGDGGIRTLPLPDGLTEMTPRAFAIQPDGKAVVGGDAVNDPEPPRARAVAVDPGGSVGFVARLSGDPKPPVTTTTTDTTTTTADTTPAPAPTTPAPAAQPVAAASANPLPATTSCVSRRSFKIRLRIPRGAVATSATVKVNGKQVKVVKGSRLRAAIDLRGLPKGKATISIVVKLAGGKKPLTGTRVYRTCVPKRSGSAPRL